MSEVITYILSSAYLLLIISTVVIIITENSNPGRTVAWLLVLMILPGVGLILYYVFGYNPRRRGECHKHYLRFRDEFLKAAPETFLEQLRASEDHTLMRPGYAGLAALLGRSNDSTVLRLALIHLSEPTRRRGTSDAVVCLKKQKE